MVSDEIARSCPYRIFVAIVLVQMVPQTTAILGGRDARIEDFPFIASVRIRDADTCGGVILSNYYILTAAHCVTEAPKGFKKLFRPFVIRRGINIMVGVTSLEDRNFFTKSPQRKATNPIKKVDSVTIYHKFKTPKYLYYDLALLRLSEKLVFSEKVNSIPLSTIQVPLSSDVTIAGWGRKVIRRSSQFQTSPQNKLQRTALKTRKCPRGVKGNFIMCLDRTNSHRITRADSGGPVIYEGKLAAILINDVEKTKIVSALNIQEKDALEWIKIHAQLKNT